MEKKMIHWKDNFPVMADILTSSRYGKASLEKYRVDACDFRARFYDHMDVGEEYMVLSVNGQLMMSDTPMERESNQKIIDMAYGDVLIGGLGLGMILFALQQNPGVKSIRVIEQSADVIELVGKQITHLLDVSLPAVYIVQGDVFDYPAAHPMERYNTVYMDIWPYYGHGMQDDMLRLQQAYTPLLKPNGWFGCWQEDIAFGAEYSMENESYYFGAMD